MPIPAEEAVISYDMDSAMFSQIYIDKSLSSTPSNLIYPSGFMLDSDNIGLLWYDFAPQIQEDMPKQRIMRSSLFCISKRQWKEINLIGNEMVTFRYGHTLITKYGSEGLEDLIILGGIDLSKPDQNTELYITKLDFKNAFKFQ